MREFDLFETVQSGEQLFCCFRWTPNGVLSAEDRTPRRTHIFLGLVSVGNLIAPLTFSCVWLKT